MTDKEFEKELSGLMETETSVKKKKSRKRILIAVVVAAGILYIASKVFFKGDAAMPVITAALTRGDIQEELSVSGPVSGTDSAEVVSNLHAEILEILVKEGDTVQKGQLLAKLDTEDVEREVDIAENAYRLAVANMEDAQKQAEDGYAKAVQDEKAAQLEYDRTRVLFQSGDVARVEFEKVENTLADAKRQVQSYTLENGKAVAAKSYELQVKNAQFELEQKKKRLEDTEIVSPIAGIVTRVNSKVGRFADVVDNDKPLFEIADLAHLELRIDVSEYSIGKVKLGQPAEISADILDGAVEEGQVTAISPTGEIKGSGSAERVIPITIRILSADTKLIAGINARAKIVLSQAEDVFVVPVSAVMQKADGVYLAVVENGAVRLIPVETGVESDINVEVRGDGLTEGMSYIPAPDASLTDGITVAAMPQ